MSNSAQIDMNSTNIFNLDFLGPSTIICSSALVFSLYNMTKFTQPILTGGGEAV